VSASHAVSVAPGSQGSVATIAADVRSGRRSASAVLAEHQARVGASEADVHAFNLVLTDEAQAAARTIDENVAAGRDPGPLAGVPIALKDNMCTRGIPTTCSSKILDGWKPPYDATVVSRLAAAGAVLVGKTNLDEFAMGSSTENSAFAAVPRVGRRPRSPPGSPPPRSAPTPADRFASPRRCAASSA
jgi:aspartyl-tRNA(Asn)/glutamyl-tRNA(Gln) amidotransferase subunit A